MYQTHPPLSKKTKIIIILLVLLIHLLLLIPFVSMQFNFSPAPELEQKLKNLHKKVHTIPDEPEEWATLNSRAMQMSAPVILVSDTDDTDQDQPDRQEPQQPNDQREELGSQEQDNVHDKLTDKEPEPEQVAQTNTHGPKPEETIFPQQTHIDIPESALSPIKQPEQPQEKKPETQKPTAQTKKETPPVQKARTPAAPKPAMQRTQPTVQKTQPKPLTAKKQPPLSLTQLAQGFVDHMRQEGEHAISMSGKSDAKATEAQLKVGRFLQRIVGAIQNSWKYNRSRYPLSEPVIASIQFTIVINKDGSLHAFLVEQSTGNALLDKYVETIIKDASSSFPSTPDYISNTTYPVRCNITDMRFPDVPNFTLHR